MLFLFLGDLPAGWVGMIISSPIPVTEVSILISEWREQSSLCRTGTKRRKDPSLCPESASEIQCYRRPESNSLASSFTCAKWFYG